MAELVSFRSGDMHEKLDLRATPSLAAKFATQRYLVLMETYAERARDLLEDEDWEYLYEHVFPHIDLTRPDTIGMLYAYAEKYGASTRCVERLKEIWRDEPILLDVFIDDYRQADRMGVFCDEAKKKEQVE